MAQLRNTYLGFGGVRCSGSNLRTPCRGTMFGKTYNRLTGECQLDDAAVGNTIPALNIIRCPTFKVHIQGQLGSATNGHPHGLERCHETRRGVQPVGLCLTLVSAYLHAQREQRQITDMYREGLPVSRITGALVPSVIFLGTQFAPATKHPPPAQRRCAAPNGLSPVALGEVSGASSSGARPCTPDDPLPFHPPPTTDLPGSCVFS